MKNKLFINLILASVFISQLHIKDAQTNTIKIEAPVILESPNNLKDIYILGIGDVLDIKFFGAEEFNDSYKILPDGNIILPIVGAIYLKDLSIPNATLLIEKNLSRELIRNDIAIKLKKARPIKIAILGEVKNPGLYTLKSNSALQSEMGLLDIGLPSVIDAIQNAGGISDKADLTNVVLRRNVEEEDFYKKANLNLVKLIKDGDFSQNPFLFDGDVININTASSDSNNTNNDFQVLTTNLTPLNIKIDVIGEVVYPGPKIVSSNTSLYEAIMKAGGPKSWKGNKGNIRLVRFNKDGSISSKKYKLKPTNISNSENPKLNNGDIINVYPTNLEKVSTALETFTRPISSFVQAYTLYKVLD